MSNSTPNRSEDKPVVNSHSGDEPKPQGAFKTVNYDEETGGASVEVTPASKEAQALAAGEEVSGKRGSSSSSTDDDVDSMTVADLHTEASRLNIEGRSGMDSDQLRKAVKKARKQQ